MNVALLYGGRSCEKEISIITALQVATFFPLDYNLIPVYMHDGELYLKYNYKRFASYVDKQTGEWKITKKDKKLTFTNGGLADSKKFTKIDCALLCTHGGEGEDGTLSALLEYYSIPYTTSNQLSSAICMDKSITKRMLSSYGFRVVDDWNGTDYPVIIKPTNQGSSIGICIVNCEDELIEAKSKVSKFGEYIIEKYLQDAVEFNCAVIKYDNDYIVSAVEKPICEHSFLQFEDKYKKGEKEIPANIPPELTKLIQETSIEIYKKLNLYGVVRIDYLYHDEKLYVNEINTIPGSLAYYLFSEVGINFERLINILLYVGLKRGTPKRLDYKTGILQNFVGMKGK